MYSQQGICLLLAELVYVVHYNSCFVYGPLPRIDIFDSRPCVEISTQNWGLQAHPQPASSFGYATRIGQSAVHILGLQYQCRFWMFEPPGCIGELLMAHGRYSYNPPSFRDRISSHALCFSSNVQLIPHVVKCYTCVFQCMQNYCLVRNYCWRHVFLPPNSFCMFVILHAFAGFETAKKPNETAKKPDETAKQIKSLKCGNWSGEKNWKRRTFRQPAIFIAVSDFER